MKIYLIIFFSLFHLFTYSQKNDNVWNYQEFWEITKIWDSSTSYENKLSACQIPEKLLHEMSTENLIKTCLKFPFLLDVYVFDNVQQGFDRILSNFNGIKELYLRNDAATVLLSYYKKNKSEYLDKPYLIEKKYEKQRGKFVIELDNLELLLSQYEILEKLTKNERLILAKECIEKHDKKCENNDLYGIENIHSTILILGRLLQQENEYHISDNKLMTTEAIRNGKISKTESFNEIIKNARIYASEE
jgi:hypothetical protein